MTQDESNGTADVTDQLIDAILTHVTFDGWSDEAFKAALGDTDISPDLARVLFPRGARDLARACARGICRGSSGLACAFWPMRGPPA